ncbi:MAG: hypothetical protein GXO69_08985 [Acidobacteria bacterium]|nr:hypothetical protein [Acidobacteriota bacterium]
MKTGVLNIVRLIWILIVLFLAAVWRVEALILIFGLVFFGPLLRETGICHDVDERQQSLHWKAGYYGFMSLMIVLFAVFVWNLLIVHKELKPEWWLLLIVPLIVRSGFYSWKGTGLRRLGLGLGFTFGGIWTVFTLLSHGFSTESLIESAVGFAILFPTAASIRWPRIGGLFLFLAGIGFAFMLIHAWDRMNGIFQIILMWCILPLPPIIAGISLFRYGANWREEDGKKIT